MFKVAQCWDDGVVSDIIVADLCRKYGAKATFNLNPGLNPEKVRGNVWMHQGFPVVKLAKSEMRSVYQGFRVASHNMTHAECDRVTEEEFLKEALDARKFCEDLFQREARGFAWPCGRYTQSLADRMLEAGFVYGRTTKNVLQVMPPEHPMIFHSSCHFRNENFMEILERSKEFGVFYFWGHSYELHDDPARIADLEAKYAAINAIEGVQWVDVVDLFDGNGGE